MVDFTVKIEGLDKIGKGSERVMKSIEKEIHKGLFVSAKKVEGEAKNLIRKGPKTGKIYKRRSVTHRASAPGEPPASDTGRLLNSINSFLQKDKMYSFVVAGRGVVKYARYLEFGTAKMAPRPFFNKALETNKRWIIDRLKKAVADGIEKGSKKK